MILFVQAKTLNSQKTDKSRKCKHQGNWNQFVALFLQWHQWLSANKNFDSIFCRLIRERPPTLVTFNISCWQEVTLSPCTDQYGQSCVCVFLSVCWPDQNFLHLISHLQQICWVLSSYFWAMGVRICFISSMMLLSLSAFSSATFSMVLHTDDWTHNQKCSQPIQSWFKAV